MAERSFLSWLGIIADLMPVWLKYRALPADQRKGAALQSIINEALTVFVEHTVTFAELQEILNSPNGKRLLAMFT